MPDIVTVTMNPAIDVSTSTGKFVAEKKLRCTPETRHPGGGGINVARVVCRLGHDVVAAYPVGGVTGKWLEKIMEAEGIRSLTVPIDGRTRESFTVVEEPTGYEFRFILPGPEMSENEWTRCLHIFTAFRTPPRYVVSSGSLSPGVPADFHAQVAAAAKRNGAKAVVDVSGEALKAAVEEGVYLLKLNLHEMQEFTGKTLDTKAKRLTACRALIEEGKAEAVCLTMGRDGAMIVSAGEAYAAEALQVEAHSTVGAGDSFLGGMIWALAEDKDLKTAFCYGVAASAAALLNPGKELSRKEDVERLFPMVEAKKL
jgi:6-phosphofructokinase 2